MRLGTVPLLSIAGLLLPTPAVPQGHPLASFGDTVEVQPVGVEMLLAGCLAWGPVAAAEGTAEAEAPAEPEPAPPRPLEAEPFFVALSVADAEKSAAWYGEVLGFDLARRVDTESGVRIRILRRPGALLELVQHPKARARRELEPPMERSFLLHGTFKTGFLVKDLDAAVKRLEALGVPLRGQVFTEPDGTFRSLQVEDPDGNVLQLFERLGPPWEPLPGSPQ